ncbi:MAG: hypothetical protein QNJ68_01405 [Microcoleaceae cyanobacterium MO_207.B10]|nr:hypothetical protein [Microcoleaceae cyanobacterium MO_207.B10]
MVFQTISMTIIAMATLGVLPSYGLQSSTSTDVFKSPLAQSSSSVIPIETTKSNPPYTLLADNRYASIGQEVDRKAVDSWGGRGTYFSFGGLPLWKHLSDEQKGRLAQGICNYSGGDNIVLIVLRKLGGDMGDLLQASSITTASMHTVCPDKYYQLMRELPSQLLR